MTETQSMKNFLERTLALAHAALEEPTAERVASARRHAAEVFPRLRRIEKYAMTLGEARQLAELITELRSVIAAVEAPRAAGSP
jgi:hypothetical protein